MGIVFKQSFINTIILFVGFCIGGMNVLFLYTHFLEAEYFGLITFLLSTANMIMPLMVFGMQHTIIKFFSSYKTREQRDNFLLTAIILPLAVIIPLSVIGIIFYHQIAEYLSRENMIIEKYTYLIFFHIHFHGLFRGVLCLVKSANEICFRKFHKRGFCKGLCFDTIDRRVL